jgi:exonuclease SbcC
MIRAIELTNWKTHGHTRLDFSRGTNILLGPMGAGKSTIMDAIAFALFGTYPALQHRRLGVGGIIMSRPEQKSSASVKLGFDIDGDTYEVERGIDADGPGKATLSKNGAYVQSQPKRVNEEIERLLKVDYDLFSRAVYSEQNRLTYFLELRPGERKEQIDELLGLDKFALAQDNAGSLINKIKDSVSESEKALAALDPEKMKGQYESLLREIKEAENSVAAIKAELELQEKKKSAAESKLSEAKAQFERKTALLRETAELKSRMSVISGEIEKIEKKGVEGKPAILKALEEVGASLKALNEAEKKAAAEEQKSRDALVHLESDVKSAAKESGERDRLRKEHAGKDRKKVEEAIRSASEKLKLLRESHGTSVAAKNDSEKWLRELEGHDGKCPLCERELTPDARSKMLQDRSETVKRLDAEISAKAKEIAALEKSHEADSKELQGIASIEERLALYKDLDSRLAEGKAELAKAQEESGRLRTAKDAASNAVSRAKERLLELESKRETAERLERHLQERDKASESLAAKEKETGSLSIDQKTLDSLQESFTAQSSRARELRAQLDAEAKRAKEKATQAEDKKKEVEMLQRMQENVGRRKNAVENLKKFRNALEETQTALRSRLIGSINEVMQEIWPELYPYGDYQGIALEPTADDYALKVRTGSADGQKWEDVNAVASGGEKSIACLAMRVAFALVLVPNLKWIILDEPTHNIDRQGLNKFVKSISEVMPRIVDQVFIITHDEMLRQVENAKIYQLNRNKEENGETVVEEA